MQKAQLQGKPTINLSKLDFKYYFPQHQLEKMQAINLSKLDFK